MQCAFRKFDTYRRFGVELEIGNKIRKPSIRRHIATVSDKSIYTSRYNLSTNNPYWHVKDDSTCGPQGKGGPKGIEIASFVASGLADLNHICQVADYLADKGVEVNDNCGLHIHADATDISEEQVGRILASWIKVEPFLALALPRRRIGNAYCQMMWHHDGILDLRLNPQTIYDALKPKDISYYENQDRRVTLNLVNYCRAVKLKNNVRKTLELRWPEGTLCSNEIKNWVRLFLNFVEHAKDAPVPLSGACPTIQEAMGLLGLGHANKFTILSEGLLKTKIWLLERIVNNPDLDYSMLMMGAPARFIPNKKDCVEYLNFISDPVKKYS